MAQNQPSRFEYLRLGYAPNARIVDWLTDGIERIALHHDIARLAVVEGGEGAVHGLDPVNWPVD